MAYVPGNGSRSAAGEDPPNFPLSYEERRPIRDRFVPKSPDLGGRLGPVAGGDSRGGGTWTRWPPPRLTALSRDGRREDPQVVAPHDLGGVGWRETAPQHRVHQAGELVVVGEESGARRGVGADAHVVHAHHV